MPTTVNIYKLVNMMDFVSEEHTVFIRSTTDVETLIDILGAIQFKFEELMNEGVTVEGKHYATFLQKYYGMEDVTEICKVFLPYTKMPAKKDWGMVTNFDLNCDGDTFTIIQIELYLARESCCGPGYDELMNKNLPKDKEFERDIINLKPYFLQGNY